MTINPLVIIVNDKIGGKSLILAVLSILTFVGALSYALLAF